MWGPTGVSVASGMWGSGQTGESGWGSGQTGSSGASGATGPPGYNYCPPGTSCTCNGRCCPLSGTCFCGVCYSSTSARIPGRAATTACGQCESKCSVTTTCCLQGYTCCPGTFYLSYFCCPGGSTCNSDGTCTVTAYVEYNSQYCSYGTGYPGYTGFTGESGLRGPAKK